MNFIAASVTHIYRATKFCTETPNIFGSSGPNLLHIILLAQVFWDESKIFGKFIHPWPSPNLERVHGTNGETGSVLHFLCDTAWELSVDEGIMLCGPLGTLLHGCEGHYLYHVRVHRHCVVSEDVLNSSAIVQEYLTYPLRQVAGRSCHSAQFLPCDNSDIDLQWRFFFFLRKRIRGSLD